LHLLLNAFDESAPGANKAGQGLAAVLVGAIEAQGSSTI